MSDIIYCFRPSGCVCQSAHQADGCNASKKFPIHRPPVFQDVLDDDALREKHLGGPQVIPERPETVLDEATRLTDRTRKDVYAHPTVNFDRIARMWSVILGVDVSPEQHALCMIAVKLSRLVETPGHRDSLVDLAGYARTIELLYDETGGETR